MSRGHKKIFSILGPKLSGSKAQQYYRDKILQIRVEGIDYHCLNNEKDLVFCVILLQLSCLCTSLSRFTTIVRHDTNAHVLYLSWSRVRRSRSLDCSPLKASGVESSEVKLLRMRTFNILLLRHIVGP